jgi:hypothetical protein
MLFRIFVVAAGFVAYCIFCDSGNSFNFVKIFDNWLKWDANNYIRISEGYTSFNIDGDYSTIVFFPLYSWLLAFVRAFIPNANAAGLLLSALLSSGACIYMYKLVCIDYSKKTAQLSVILMCIFPFGFFYSSIMSESAFLLTSLMTLYYVRKHNWMIAGISGLLSALSRSAGVFLIFPATVEFIEEYKLFGDLKDVKDIFNKILTKWAWMLLLPLGTLIYLFINYHISGDPFYFLKMEKKYWQQETQLFFNTASNYINILNGDTSVSTKMAAFFPGFICLLSSYALIAVGLLRHRNIHMVWLLIYLTLNTTMSWPLSFCRYISCAVPLYIILADLCENNKKLETGLIMGWGILFGIYLVGYMTTKQIM